MKYQWIINKLFLISHQMIRCGIRCYLKAYHVFYSEKLFRTKFVKRTIDGLESDCIYILKNFIQQNY